MKLNEQWTYDHKEDKWVQQKTYDWSHGMDVAKQATETNGGVMGESRLVGTIPSALIAQWCKEAGVRFDDIEKKKEVIKRKILSGDFDKFRVWKGRY